MWAIEGGVAVSEYVGAVSTAYRVYELSPEIHPKFIHHWFRSSVALEQYRLLVRGITTFDRSVTREDFEGMPVPVPAVTTQRAIADFLDLETTRIDALIAAKHRLIDLLVEKFRVATVDYLSLTVGNGKSRRLGAFASISLGRQRTPEYEFGPNMARYLRAANVKDGTLDLSDVKLMNFTPKEQAIFQLRMGDVLVTEGAGSLAAVGATAVWQDDLPGVICFQNTLLRLRPRPSVDPRYLAWWCRGAYYGGLMAAVSQGANIYHLSAERLKAVPCLIPPTSEQRSRIARLDRIESKLQAARGALERQIALLLEHRQALITETLASDFPLSRVTA
jgi:restriction endonuclease S subunit